MGNKTLSYTTTVSLIVLAHRRYLLSVPLDLHLTHISCYTLEKYPKADILKIQALVLVLAM